MHIFFYRLFAVRGKTIALSACAEMADLGAPLPQVADGFRSLLPSQALRAESPSAPCHQSESAETKAVTPGQRRFRGAEESLPTVLIHLWKNQLNLPRKGMPSL